MKNGREVVLGNTLYITDCYGVGALQYLLDKEIEWNLGTGDDLQAPVLLIGNDVPEEVQETVQGWEHRCVPLPSEPLPSFESYVSTFRKFIKIQEEFTEADAECMAAAEEFGVTEEEAPVLVEDQKDFDLLVELRAGGHWKGNTIRFCDERGEGERMNLSVAAKNAGITVHLPQ